MKKFLFLLITTPAWGWGYTVDHNGNIHCRGCRYKNIDGVQYVCTGSLANESCTKREQFIKNARKPKAMNNEDMSYLRTATGRGSIRDGVPE